jgi:hypothetical protein
MIRTNVSNVNHPSHTPTELRREVKAITRYVDSEIATYKSIREVNLDPGHLWIMAERLTDVQRKITALKDMGLSAVRPESSIGRSFKNTALLSGAVVSRVAAVPVAVALGVAETGVRLAVAPLSAVTAGCGGGISGAVLGGVAAPLVLKPVGVLAGCVGGSVVCGLSAAATGVVNAPIYSVHKGSMMRTAFNKLDQFDVASAHVNRKKLSTSEIANNTDEKIVKTINKISAKAQKLGVTFC